MSPTTILYVIIAIVIADYLLERGLSFLNCRSISTQLPDEVKEIYSEEKYQQSQEYKRANCRFELVTASLKVVILLALISFALLYSPLSTVMGLAMNSFSRHNEYEADRFAAHHFNAAALGSALKKLSVNNLSNLTPHPAYVFFHYSHPPLLNRLRALSTT
ncbi:MAG: M48 family metalloprotease [Deltaproteobacteria bacterium]|nr:M48 family metalloprotease [Deltaproteobacteria bacterium]